jgi:hypothetical protein
MAWDFETDPEYYGEAGLGRPIHIPNDVVLTPRGQG